MTPSTWPDPQRGGVPMEPEKDGWHWLGYIYAPETFPKLWLLGRWCHAGGGSWVEAAEVAKTLRYIAPCPPPELIRTDADLATTASVHAAAGFEAGLEASAQWHDREVAKWLREAKKHTRLNGVRSDCEQRDLQRAAEHHKHAAALRALPIPDASALEAAIKEAEERGAAKALPGNLAELIEAELIAWQGASGGIYTIHACALAVSTLIRARTQETPDAG